MNCRRGAKRLFLFVNCTIPFKPLNRSIFISSSTVGGQAIGSWDTQHLAIQKEFQVFKVAHAA